MREEFDQYGYYNGAIPNQAVADCTGPGPTDEAVAYWQNYLGFNVPRNLAIPYLTELGAWDRDELNAWDDTRIAQTVLWVACGDIKESQEDWIGLVH